MIEDIFDSEPRKEVLDFAKVMEHKLAQNDYKGGWEDLSCKELFGLLEDELDELWEELEKDSPCPVSISKEAADVAGFAMMIHNLFGVRDEGSEKIKDKRLSEFSLSRDIANKLGRESKMVFQEYRGPQLYDNLVRDDSVSVSSLRDLGDEIYRLDSVREDLGDD